MKPQAVSLLVLGVLAIGGWLFHVENKHMHSPHTVVHRDGRRWYLSGSPFGHRINGALQTLTTHTITFMGDDGFPVTFQESDVRVICPIEVP
jgi:hypothetical protein